MFYVILGIFFIYIYFSCYIRWAKIPHLAPRYPIFGNVFGVFKLTESLSTFCQKLYEQGETHIVYGFYFFQTPAILVREPELVKKVLRTEASSFRSFMGPNEASDPLLAKCPPFRRDTLARNIITDSRLSGSVVKLQMLCEDMTRYFDVLLENSPDSNVIEIDVHNIMVYFTETVIKLFGFDSLADNPDELNLATDLVSVIKTIFKPSFINGVKQNICLFAPSLAHRLQMRMVSKKFDATFRKLVGKILQRRRYEYCQEWPRRLRRYNVLDWIVEESIRQNAPYEDFATQLFAFLIESFTFLSVVGSFSLFYLAWDSRIQQRARDESEPLAFLSFENFYSFLNDMRLHDRIITETLRLRPPFGVISRTCTQRVELVRSDGIDCTVSPGELVFISNQALHLDRHRRWYRPEAFFPDRYYNPLGRCQRECGKFWPFEDSENSGVMKFNIIVLKMMLFHVLNKYVLTTSNKVNPTNVKISKETILTTPESGLWITLSKRTRESENIVRPSI